MPTRFPAPSEWVAMPDERLASAAGALLQHPREAQEATLMHILALAANTKVGRQYGFANLSSYQAFARRLPPSEWTDYRPFSPVLENGEEDILFPGKPLYFLKTSGTSGEHKKIPQSAQGDAAARAVTRLRTLDRQAAAAQKNGGPLPPGRVFLFPSLGALEQTAGGIPVGFSSGITAARTPPHLRRLRCCPDEVFSLRDVALRDCLLLRFALGQRDVVGAMGNSSLRFARLLDKAKQLAPRLTKDIRLGRIDPSLPLDEPLRTQWERTLAPDPGRADELAALLAEGTFTPKQYWPRFNFACFWLAGSMGRHVQTLRPLLPEDTLYYDPGYGASELKINLPDRADDPHGPPALFAGFFEFLPLGGGPALLLDQLQEGGLYEILITTYSGLYRYRLGDLVRVEGKRHNTPRIAFVSKTGDVANLAGEKVAGALLLKAAQAATKQTGDTLVFCQVYPQPEEGRYLVYCETECATLSPEEWALQFDDALCDLSGGYARRRAEGSLHLPKVRQMPCGWHRALLDEKESLGGESQLKLPLVLPRPLF